MKNILLRLLVALTIWIAISATAQTVQYVTLTSTNTLTVQTNQIVSLVGFDWKDCSFVNSEWDGIGVDLANGDPITLTPYTSGVMGGASSQNVLSSQIPQIVTGATNIYLFGSVYWATFKIETPATTTVISNYVPADAIVIPASATGNVQIILESSPDLVNWTASSPGTYGASAGTNRFFRVRAAVN